MSGLAQPADLGAPDLRRLIVRLALPAVVGLSISALHHAANAVFLGMLGTEAVSAVSGVFPIIVLMASVGEGIGVGTASYVSRMLGAKRVGHASRAATMGMALAVAAGIALATLLFLNLDGVLAAFGVTPAALPLARSYMHVFCLSYTLVMLQIFGDLLSIAEGNTRFSMWVLLGAFALNIALDPVFIFVLGFGVEGAAIATLLSQATAVCAYGLYFLRRLGTVRIRLPFLALNGRILREIILVGGPATAASAMTALAFALVYKTAGEYGDAAVAGIGIALRLFSLGALPVFGFSLGARAVLGFGWGAADYGRVLRAIGFLLAVTSAFCLLYGGAVMLFARPIVSLFTKDAEVLALGIQASFALHLLFPLFGLQVVLMTFLQASGQARLATLVLLAPQGYFLLPGLLLLPKFWGLSGLLASQIVAAGLTAILVIVVLLRQIVDLRRRAGRLPRLVSASVA